METDRHTETDTYHASTRTRRCHCLATLSWGQLDCGKTEQAWFLKCLVSDGSSSFLSISSYVYPLLCLLRQLQIFLWDFHTTSKKWPALQEFTEFNECVVRSSLTVQTQIHTHTLLREELKDLPLQENNKHLHNRDINLFCFLTIEWCPSILMLSRKMLLLT